MILPDNRDGNQEGPTLSKPIYGKAQKQALEAVKIKLHAWDTWVIFFIIGTGTEDELEEIIDYLNDLRPTIKFTSEHSSIRLLQLLSLNYRILQRRKGFSV